MGIPQTRKAPLTDTGGLSDTSFSSEQDVGPQCMIIMYHYVRNPDPLDQITQGEHTQGIHGPTVEEFKSQLESLARTMEPIDWPTFYAWQRGLGSIPSRCFLTTFDDGLADHPRHVVPILNELGLRGVFFVPAEVLTTNQLISAHTIHLLLSRMDDATFEKEMLDEVSRSDPDAAKACRSLNEDAARSMYHYENIERARLKYQLTVILPPETRNVALQALFEKHIGSSLRWARKWYLNWEDLAQMQAMGHTIGGHGFSHEPLTRLTPVQQRDELKKMALVLREGLGPDLRPMSYPYGAYNDETVKACYSAGFAHAFTTQKRWAVRGEDVFRIPRFDTVDVEHVLAEDRPCQRS